MVVFGIAVADHQAYARWAARGIERVAEPDSVVLAKAEFSSVQARYNSILDEAAQSHDLEAVVLLHEDTEIVDSQLLTKIRNGFADPRVGVMGPIGGRNCRGIAWWEGVSYGRVAAPNVSLDPLVYAANPWGWHHVETIDGLMLVLSPWATREVRFDERFARTFHGYDVDYCFQVRARGRQCLVAPLQTIHYGTWKPERSDTWIDAELEWQRKWGRSGVLPRPCELAWA